MTNSNLPNIMTLEEVADYLKVDKGVVLSELEKGNIRGFKLGAEWRITEAGVLEFVSGNHALSLVTQRGNNESGYKPGDFDSIGPFEYRWPTVTEQFESGYETTRSINGRTYTFKIGYTNRQAAGQMRRRVVVWIDNWPVVELAGGNDYESNELLASIIKTQNGKQLRPSGKIPEEYKDFHVVRYDSIVQGPYASRNMAIVVSKDDLETMIRHAIIRATLKGLV